MRQILDQGRRRSDGDRTEPGRNTRKVFANRTLARIADRRKRRVGPFDPAPAALDGRHDAEVRQPRETESARKLDGMPETRQQMQTLSHSGNGCHQSGQKPSDRCSIPKVHRVESAIGGRFAKVGNTATYLE